MKSNPFATRFVRPGGLPWVESNDSSSPDYLVTRFRHQLNYRAAIVGPHGTGKSTLLEHLVPKLGEVHFKKHAASSVAERSDLGNVVWLTLRRGPQLDRLIAGSQVHWREGGLLVLDGFEQLSWLRRRWVLSRTRAQKVGLLVTCHEPIHLPVLHATSSSVAVLRRIVELALTAHSASRCLANVSGTALAAGQFPDTPVASAIPLTNLATNSPASAVPGPSEEVRRLTRPELLSRLFVEERGNIREILMRLYDSYEQNLQSKAQKPPPSQVP